MQNPCDEKGKGRNEGTIARAFSILRASRYPVHQLSAEKTRGPPRSIENTRYPMELDVDATNMVYFPCKVLRDPPLALAREN